MDKLNVKTRNVERSDEIDSRLVDKIEGFRSDVDKKVRDLSEAYSESGNDDEKNLIAFRISALKCDIPEIHACKSSGYRFIFIALYLPSDEFKIMHSRNL